MTLQILALIVVVISFALLFGWVFWPGNKQRFEGLGRTAIDLDASETESATAEKDPSS